MARSAPTRRRSAIPGVTAKRIPGQKTSPVPGQPNRIPGAGRVSLRDTRGRYVRGGSGIAWEGLEIITDNIARVAEGCHEARRESAEITAQRMESHAKAYAPWNDVTGSARRGLKTVVIDNQSNYTTQVNLGHSVNYGAWLETRDGGRLAIILPTMVEFSRRVTDNVVGLNPLGRRVNR